MIHIRLKGGMGNQMFQYAFALGQAARLNSKLKIDCASLLDRTRGKGFVYRDYDLGIFNFQADFVLEPSLLRTIYKLKFSKISRWIKAYAQKGLKLEKEKHFHVDNELIKKPVDNRVYDGWWQSEKYFENVKEEVRKAFSFKQGILPESRELYEKIRNTESVCLNVRRTDFLTTPTLNATNLEYFLKAAKSMGDLVEDPHFFIFSDDLEWCKENIVLDYPMDFVTHDLKGRKFGNYLQLMKSCKNFIIPNSSFAWWAVWLNEDLEKKVIAPKNWFNEGGFDTSDVIPDAWIRI